MRKIVVFSLLATTFAAFNPNLSMAQRNDRVNNAADPVRNLNFEQRLRWADGLFKKGSYYNAVDYYEGLLKDQPRNPYIVYKLAEGYGYLRDYPNAAKYYGYAYELASTLYPMAIYEEAIMLKMNGEYDKAEERFKKFIADNPKKYKKEKKRAQLEIDGIAMGRKSMANPEPATVKNLGPNVNTPYTQSAPMPLGDTAILYATQNITELAVTSSNKSSDYYSKLMVSRKQKYTDVVDTFSWPIEFNDGKFNSTSEHIGNGVFSPGGDRFFFTKCSERDSNEMECKLYESKFIGDRWSQPKLMGNNINVTGSSSTNPHIAKVGKQEVLFFASNRKMQSRGGYDIWYSVYDERQKTYRRPQNAGKKINTVADEITPYYDERQQTLYFASNGWKTLGGFDIYAAPSIKPGKYADLFSLGYPINTPYDDFNYIQDPIGKYDAYLVSNRPGSISIKNPTCCDDIWRVQYEPKITVNGVVMDSKKQTKVGNVVVKMVDDQGNVKTFESEDGVFQFNATRDRSYVLSADKQYYITSRTQFNTQGIKREDPDRTINLTLYVDSFFLDQNFAMNNIYYDFNKATLRPESGAELEKLIKLMNENPSLDVQILAHTDGKGTKEYNYKLSEERAESVVNYLVSSGINKSRLSTLGMGLNTPAATNATEEGRQLNRRTEFKIIADDPVRRVIYNSANKGTIGQQKENLKIKENEQIGENPYTGQEDEVVEENKKNMEPVKDRQAKPNLNN